MSRSVHQILQQLWDQLLLHLAHNPYLTPSDYCLFRSMALLHQRQIIISRQLKTKLETGPKPAKWYRREALATAEHCQMRELYKPIFTWMMAVYGTYAFFISFHTKWYEFLTHRGTPLLIAYIYIQTYYVSRQWLPLLFSFSCTFLKANSN